MSEIPMTPRELVSRLKSLEARSNSAPWRLRHHRVSEGMGQTGYARQISIGENWVTIDHQTHITGEITRTIPGDGCERKTLINRRAFVPEESVDAAMIAELRNNLPMILSALEFMNPD